MAVIQKQIAPVKPTRQGSALFAVMAGLFFLVAIPKFGDPVILDSLMTPPDSVLSAVFESWPLKWGYWMLVPLVAAGLLAVPWKSLRFRWLSVLPLAWLGWQFISATHTVSPKLTTLTLKHFSAAVILFYLGYYALQGVRNPWALWAGLALALCWVMRAGFEQHFGGLEATRRFLESMKNDPTLAPGMMMNPDYLKRMASNRIFATFSSPDALAGAIELLLPVTLFFLWQITPKVRVGIRWGFVIILGGCGLACLYWTGSKAGWLVALLMGVLVLWHSALPQNWKRYLIYGILTFGVLGFAVRYAASYKKQNVSVGTRIDYWKAAVQIAAHHPIFGTGPGTFAIPYAQIKTPTADFAHLCHNDYLEQACDSGLPGFVFYTAMIVGFLVFLYRYRVRNTCGITTSFVVWLGLFGLSLHSGVDYHLYIPALAWPMLFLFGFLMNFEG